MARIHDTVWALDFGTNPFSSFDGNASWKSAATAPLYRDCLNIVSNTGRDANRPGASYFQRNDRQPEPIRMSIPFPLPLVLENLANGRKDHWCLTEPFVYRDPACMVIVPRGFNNDLASVPRIFWPILDPTNDVTLAAVPHDWLYATRGIVRPWLPAISRAQCDAIFYRALRANGVGYIRAQAMWLAVRAGGASAWKQGESPVKLFTQATEVECTWLVERADSVQEPGPEVLAP